jgi:hypothetical protein
MTTANDTMLSDNIAAVYDIIESDRDDKDVWPFMVRERITGGPSMGIRCHTLDEARTELGRIMMCAQANGRKVALA